ncbi:unnamed protein product [Ambrosiozyma monospora]|uniref:Unnamed protein product n=1 Tax=Ambrosiozyma monospora TaxID=43982 RepID=A0A9W6YYB6_AMBMO|nr:unnamed protein product [Ambrosiozyma monospora]
MLPPLNSNKYGGFSNQQDLLDASSFFNQISNSMNNSNNDHKPTIPSISSLSGSNTKNLYPIFPSSTNASTTATTTAPNTHTSPLLSGPTLPSSSSFYPQLNSRSSQQYSDSNDFVKKLNIGSSQKTSADELSKRLASMQIESTPCETDDSEADDDFKDYSSYYDQSDDEYDDMEEEIKIAEFAYHHALIDDIRDYLNFVVSSVQAEQQSHSGSASAFVEPVVKNTATRLYPVIKV